MAFPPAKCFFVRALVEEAARFGMPAAMFHQKSVVEK
jgi:hypothetical protein